MPNAETFSITPIKLLIEKWIKPNQVIIDPFARNSLIGTITNDLNKNTSAIYHMDAIEFCSMLVEQNTKADVVIFDPPYSPRQIQECYQDVGRKTTMKDTQSACLYKEVKDRLDLVLKSNGISISFGWNSNGFGKMRGYLIKEIMLVAHGGAHNDTIITVEQKKPVEFKKQLDMFKV